jgi:Tfp pilus assembly protein PilX
LAFGISPRPRRGVVALITVLVIMAVVVTIGLTIAAVGRDEIVLSGVVQDGEQAFAIADACAEEALNRLKTDAAFTGTTLAMDEGTCVAAVTNIGGTTYKVTGQGTYRRAIRIVEADVTVKTSGGGGAVKVTINSWREAP